MGMIARLVLLFGLLSGVFPTLAGADELASDWGHTHQGQVRLVAAPGSTGALRLGLQFRLAPHWKIYWRSPGDAGLPPELDWAGSSNITIGETSWPAPARFSYAGLETYGYEGEVLLPIAATLPDPSMAATVKAAVDFLTCSEICVPNHVELGLVVPAGAAGPGPWGGLIDSSTARVPGPASDAGLAILGATIGVIGKDGVLAVTLRATPPLGRPDVLVEGADGFGFQAPKMTIEDGVSILSLSAPGGAEAVSKLVGRSLSLTVIDRAAPVEVLRAASIAVTPVAGVPPGGLALLPVLVFALLGGFILNFMPCVLPVLSLKMLALVGYSGRGRAAFRAGFLASAAGVVTSFLVLAAALIGAREAGLAIGWGLQFQEPVFLAVLVAIITLFACNLFGWFEIPLPWRLAGLASFGGSSLGGSFAAGAFATVLATPCSAPFLGTAVGFALAGSPSDIVIVFLFLGIGMALPYLVVAAWPGLARRMPRPGRWMLVLRQIMGLLLAGTAAWLIGVLVLEAGPVAAWSVAGLALAAALCLLLRSSGAPRWRRALGVTSALLLAAMAAPPLLVGPGVAPSADDGAGWAPFDNTTIAASVAAGRIVFIDVTARWCLTCQVNERWVLDANAVRERLTAPNIVAMRADWTRRDARIGDFLKAYGRYGIPFNVVYGPGAPSGLPLPELLTQSAVLDALKQAAGTPS
jgi:suppressor for copper-sensitivity B